MPVALNLAIRFIVGGRRHGFKAIEHRVSECRRRPDTKGRIAASPQAVAHTA
jgi:hypothetical protein